MVPHSSSAIWKRCWFDHGTAQCLQATARTISRNQHQRAIKGYDDESLQASNAREIVRGFDVRADGHHAPIGQRLFKRLSRPQLHTTATEG